MAYWIFENGETVGPLRAVEVLEHAGPETLVSHGERWIRLREHPDFGQSVPPDVTLSERSPTSPASTSGAATGDNAHGPARSNSGPDRRPQARRRALFVFAGHEIRMNRKVVLGCLAGLLVVVVGITSIALLGTFVLGPRSSYDPIEELNSGDFFPWKARVVDEEETSKDYIRLYTTGLMPFNTIDVQPAEIVERIKSNMRRARGWKKVSSEDSLAETGEEASPFAMALLDNAEFFQMHCYRNKDLNADLQFFVARPREDLPTTFGFRLANLL